MAKELLGRSSCRSDARATEDDGRDGRRASRAACPCLRRDLAEGRAKMSDAGGGDKAARRSSSRRRSWRRAGHTCPFSPRPPPSPCRLPARQYGNQSWAYLALLPSPSSPFTPDRCSMKVSEDEPARVCPEWTVRPRPSCQPSSSRPKSSSRCSFVPAAASSAVCHEASETGNTR